MPSTILIIEDDEQVSELVARYLEREGYHTVCSANGKDGVEAVGVEHPALVLLDVNLPDLDGWSILRQLRLAGTFQPAVVMLTARSDEPDRLLGLDLGADDYIVKPFSVRELVARVKAVLRRVQADTSRRETLEFPGLRIDLAARSVWRNNILLCLTPKEYDLLLTLARQPQCVLSRSMLYDLVWGEQGQGDEHTLDVHVNRLRHKLSVSDDRRYLVTVKGVGMKFEVSHE